MKLYWMIIVGLVISFTGCASNTSETPSLESYQTKTLPTGGSDAALAAHKTY